MESLGPRSVRIRVLAGALVLFVLIAWWWPGLTGQDRQTDVAIMSSASTISARDIIDRRLREQGFTTFWQRFPEDSCSLGDPPSEPFEILVVALPPIECDPALVRTRVLQIADSVGLVRTVVVLSWHEDRQDPSLGDFLRHKGVRVVDPLPLIGEFGDAQNCLWWDDCPPIGRIVTVRNDRLTEAGHQRLARLIVAGVL